MLAETQQGEYTQPQRVGEGDQDMESVNTLSCLPLSTAKLMESQEATEKATQLQAVQGVTLAAWPKAK